MKNIVTSLSSKKKCLFFPKIHIFRIYIYFAILIRVTRNVDASWFMRKCARDCRKKHEKKKDVNKTPSRATCIACSSCYAYNYTCETTAWQIIFRNAAFWTWRRLLGSFVLNVISRLGGHIPSRHFPSPFLYTYVYTYCQGIHLHLQ